MKTTKCKIYSKKIHKINYGMKARENGFQPKWKRFIVLFITIHVIQKLFSASLFPHFVLFQPNSKLS